MGWLYVEFVTESEDKQRIQLTDDEVPVYLDHGDSYSYRRKIDFSVDEITSVNFEWYKNNFATGNKQLHVDHIILEPEDESGDERRILTKYFCGEIVPTLAKTGIPVTLDQNCRPF